jgi:hypothetical protein
MFVLYLEAATLPPAVKTAVLSLLAHDTINPQKTGWDGTLKIFVSDETVPLLAQSGDPTIRQAIAKSPRLHTALAEILARDAGEAVLLQLAINSRTSQSVLRQLLDNPHISRNVLAVIREHPHCSEALDAKICQRLEAIPS